MGLPSVHLTVDQVCSGSSLVSLTGQAADVVLRLCLPACMIELDNHPETGAQAVVEGAPSDCMALWSLYRHVLHRPAEPHNNRQAVHKDHKQRPGYASGQSSRQRRPRRVCASEHKGQQQG